VGDFNLHHPLWAAEGYEHQHEKANDLVDLAAGHQFELLLPSNTITYEKNGHHTTIDLVWGTSQVADRLVKCQARQNWWSGVDNILILTRKYITRSWGHGYGKT
jgi:hypothetical protein